MTDSRWHHYALRLEHPTHDQIKELATQTDHSVNYWINRLLHEAIETRKEQS
jgi:predicted HicB family RNase H-like nuclease